MSEIDAVGHRVVHGGEFFSDSVIITEKVLKLSRTAYRWHRFTIRLT